MLSKSDIVIFHLLAGLLEAAAFLAGLLAAAAFLAGLLAAAAFLAGLLAAFLAAGLLAGAAATIWRMLLIKCRDELI